jgi:hypothetical protein
MPRGDGTGPAGMGPMSGRAGGYCAGYSVPGYANTYGGRYAGFGGGPGFRGGFGGRGYRNWYYASGFPGWCRYDAGYPAWGGVVEYPFGPGIEPEQEKEILKRQSDDLQRQLDEIKIRMDELSGKQEKEQ